MSKTLPFRWYGGKYSHLDFILPQLPNRISFTESVGEFLNAMRANKENKERWKEVVEELGSNNS